MGEVFEFRGRTYSLPYSLLNRYGTVRLVDTGELVDLNSLGEATLHTGCYPKKIWTANRVD